MVPKSIIAERLSVRQMIVGPILAYAWRQRPTDRPTSRMRRELIMRMREIALQGAIVHYSGWTRVPRSCSTLRAGNCRGHASSMLSY